MPRTLSISSRLQFHLMTADIIHLNDLLPKCVLVTSFLNFDQFAGSYRLRCALLWSRTCRGRRAGKHVNAGRHCIAYSETSDGEIPVLSTTCRRHSNSSSGRVGDRDDPLYYNN